MIAPNSAITRRKHPLVWRTHPASPIPTGTTVWQASFLAPHRSPDRQHHLASVDSGLGGNFATQIQSDLTKTASVPLPKHTRVANLQKQQEEDPQVTTKQHRQASERFLEQARAEFAAGDLAQASEKGWGTAVQILKAVAEQRGWEHSRHRHHLVTVTRLRSETGDGDIRRLFAVASDLHENFYEDHLDAAAVAESLDDVETLQAKLDHQAVWNRGVEHPWLDEKVSQHQAEVNTEKRRALAIEIATFLFENTLTGIGLYNFDAVWPVGPRIQP